MRKVLNPVKGTKEAMDKFTEKYNLGNYVDSEVPMKDGFATVVYEDTKVVNDLISNDVLMEEQGVVAL